MMVDLLVGPANSYVPTSPEQLAKTGVHRLVNDNVPPCLPSDERGDSAHFMMCKLEQARAVCEDADRGKSPR